MKHVIVGVVALAAMPRPADACGVVSLGDIIANIDFSGTTESTATPIAMATAGMTTEGWSGGVAIGWAWGEHQEGGLFPGSNLTRVLLHVRRPFASAASDDGDVAARMTT